jgi:type IV pilus assembly protein PilQ
MRQLSGIRRLIGATLLGAAWILVSVATGDASKVSSLRMEPHSGSASYVIAKSGALEVQEFLMQDPPRLVLDLVGAEHGLDKTRFDGDGGFVKAVRTSQFSNEPQMITRIVFDLNDHVAYQVSNEADAITIRFHAKGGSVEAPPATMMGSFAPVDAASPATDEPAKPQQSGPTVAKPWSPEAFASQPAPQNAPVEIAARETEANDSAAAPEAETAAPMKPWTAPKSDPAIDQDAVTGDENHGVVPSFWTRPVDQGASKSDPMPMNTDATATAQPLQAFASQAGLVRNKNMTIDVQNANVQTVLRSMSEFSGVNIISGPEVDGKVTAHLKNVPWRQALDIILKSHGYGWREEYGMIRVSTLDKLNKEELELQSAERQKDELLPLQTQIMSLSYANAAEMQKALKEMLSARGSMEVEKGRNALVVTDIQKIIDKITALVAELDRKTKQVEIVAKMVDVDYEASREIGVRWDALNLSADGVDGIGDALVNASGADPVGIFRVGTVQSWGEVSFMIDALEKQQKANIISNPRIVTADNREANILVGKEIPLIVADEAGNPVTELTKVGIILRVTPHVNSDNSVTLDLHPEVSELSTQATVQGGVVISLSEADTRVVVGHGETAVIGGLINEVESKLERGVPGLMNLPFVGNLFKLKVTVKKKRELIIFVTPRIVDEVATN